MWDTASDSKQPHRMKKKVRKIMLALLVVGTLAACSRDERAIRQLCAEMHRQYPAATLQDLYKSCYQDFFGAEHLMSDTAAARHYLHEELSEYRNTGLTGIPEREPTGFRHRFVRISLSCVTEGKMSEEELLQRFMEAASHDNALTGDWVEEWNTIERIAIQTVPAWKDSTLQAGLRQAAERHSTVRHSDTYRETYHPHYRIVPNKNEQ